MKVIPIERHPWRPYMPPEPEILVLGTFPPKPERWAMEFYYPNRMNDFWKIMGLLYHDNPLHLWDETRKSFDLEAIKRLLDANHIAMWDTAMAVRRLKDNASDKFLEIVKEINLALLLEQHSSIKRIITAGEKATGVVASQACVPPPAMGQSTECQIAGHRFILHRVPSSSRAFPMKMENKAEYYRKAFMAE